MIALVTLLLLQGGPVNAAELVYPGSRLLLDDHVMGRELEIHWSCYASRDSLGVVVAHYVQDSRLSPGSWHMEADERGFQGKDNPELHVAIFPTRDLRRHSACQAKLEASERTVVQVSLGFRRQVSERPDATTK